MTPAAFPGGTSVTRLSVYSDPCADGLVGGTPHVHTASTEAYVVVAGRGALQTITASGFRETALSPGSTVWFTPGAIHRAVNHGDLQVVVVMQNAGLPEAGDAVMTFPPDVVNDPIRYRQTATLPLGESEAVIEAATQRRRDLAVEGFLRIARGVQAGDFGPLEQFYDSAAALVQPSVARWRQLWQDTVVRETQATARVLDALERADGGHLRQATLLEAPPSATARWGMCGRLRTYDVANPLVHESDSAGSSSVSGQS